MNIKEKVVSADFKEEHVRKTLNFGHTIGHALESLFLKSGKAIPHGEAVVLGMICETHLSFLNHLISLETSETIIKNLQRFYPYLSISAFTNTEILALMKNDKKNSAGIIKFSLLTAIGACNFDFAVAEEQILEALHFYQNLGLK